MSMAWQEDNGLTHAVSNASRRSNVLRRYVHVMFMNEVNHGNWRSSTCRHGMSWMHGGGWMGRREHLSLVLGVALDGAQLVGPVGKLALVAVSARTHLLPGAAQLRLQHQNL